jgi:hypothetical protein
MYVAQSIIIFIYVTKDVKIKICNKKKKERKIIKRKKKITHLIQTKTLTRPPVRDDAPRYTEPKKSIFF